MAIRKLLNIPQNQRPHHHQRGTRDKLWSFQPVRGIYIAGGLAPIPGKQGAPRLHPPAAGRRCGNSARPDSDRRLETFLSGN